MSVTAAVLAVAPTALCDSSEADTSVLSIIVDGGTVTLADPHGRMDQVGVQPKSEIPNCSRIEGHTSGVHSIEEAATPHTELDLLSPGRGSYRIKIQAVRSLVSVQASGELGGMRCGFADHLFAVSGRSYRWHLWWGLMLTARNAS